MVSKREIIAGIAIAAVLGGFGLFYVLTPQDQPPNVKFETFSINGDNNRREINLRVGETAIITVNARNYENVSYSDVRVRIETDQPTSDNFLRIVDKEIQLRPLQGINQNTGDKTISITALELDAESKAYSLNAILLVNGEKTQEMPFRVTIIK